MDTEKKTDEAEATKQPKQDIGEVIGDLIVSGATVLAHSAAEAVVKRVKNSAAKTGSVKTVAKVVKKAKKSVTASKSKKAKKASQKSDNKSAGKKTAKRSTKKNAKKKSKR